MTSVYYTIFTKKPERLLGVAGIHQCEADFLLCWFGQKGKRAGFRQLFATQEDALEAMTDLFGDTKKLAIYEVDFKKYVHNKGQLK